jgi:Hemerythrin HHE cation binding domain
MARARKPAASPPGSAEPLIDHMRADHAEIGEDLAWIRRALSRGVARSSLRDARDRLRDRLTRHFDLEEQTLFGLLLAATKGRALDAVELLRKEHEAILEALARFSRALDGGRDPRPGFETLRKALSLHRVREEGLLYPLSGMLCPPELRQVVAGPSAPPKESRRSPRRR